MAETDAIDSFLQKVAATAEAPRFVTVPRAVDRYVVREPLGRGGLGLVYAAWDPVLGREVAVKLVRPDRTGGEVGMRLQERLRREARALAALAHPNVVPVFDVGAIGDRVFIVMQKIDGPTLRRWCDAEPRALPAILAMFRAAGEGLAAAHAVGVVHRDFKPDNVLIRPDGVAVVVDFGLAAGLGAAWARSLPSSDARDTAGSGSPVDRVTHTGAIVGTVGYLAPEQRRGEPASPLGDQYSFCVSLWEALFGRLPTPSANVRHPCAAILRRGLDPDPTRRWPSMRALLDALSRTRGRNRWRHAALGAAVLGSLGWGASRLAAASPDCRGGAPTMDGVWDDAAKVRLQSAIVGSDVVDPVANHARLVRAIDDHVEGWTAAWDRACSAVSTTDPSTQTLLPAAHRCLVEQRAELEALLLVLDDAPAATTLYAAVPAVAGLPSPIRCTQERWLTRQAEDASEHSDPLRARLWRVRALRAAGAADAIALARALVLDATTTGHGAIAAAAMVELGKATADRGEPQEAAEQLERAHALAVEGGDDDIALAAASALVATLAEGLGRPDDALRWGELARAIVTRIDATGEAEDGRVLADVALAYSSAGRLDEAEATYREALAILERSLGEGHPSVGDVHERIGNVHYLQGRYADAEAAHRRALAILLLAVGPEHPSVIRTQGALATMVFTQGRHDEAEALYRETLEIAVPVLGEHHPLVSRWRSKLASAHATRGEYAAAVQQHRLAIAALEHRLGSDDNEVAIALNDLSAAYRFMQRHDDAVQTLLRAHAIFESRLGPEHAATLTTLQNLATTYGEAGNHADARRLLERVVETRERVLGPEHPAVGITYNNLGNVYVACEDWAAADRAFTRAIAILEGAHGSNDPIVAHPLVGRARARANLGNGEAAVIDAERGLALRKDSDASAVEIAEAELALAVALWSAETDRDLARALARHALALHSGSAADSPERREIATWLAAHAED